MPSAKKAAPKAKVIKLERSVVYPEIKTRLAAGEDALTVEQAKELLGWTEDRDRAREAGCNEPLFTDLEGKKVYCLNNLTNRPFYSSNADTLKQEILNRRWRFNFEPMIIGTHGSILNGQHTLVALCLAEQERTSDKQKHHWEGSWDGPCTIEKLIGFGCPEDDSTVNTMDTGKPRTLTDVIYRSPYFAKLKSAYRIKCSRMASYAVRFLWSRTGASDAFHPRQTHAESLDFIDRHPTLLKCVKHIFSEDGDGNITAFFSPGYASALLYLMGCSATDGDVYRNMDSPKEGKKMDFSRMDRAEEFWVLLASGHNDVLEVRYAFGALTNEKDGSGGSLQERIAILVKAWGCFVAKEPITAKTLVLRYITDEDGIKHLGESPILGGIDIGSTKEKDEDPEDQVDGPETEENVESPEAIEQEKKRIKEEKRLKALMEAKARAEARKAAANGKAPSRKDVEAAQTAKAARMDAEAVAAE